jgi:hypothetical protein
MAALEKLRSNPMKYALLRFFGSQPAIAYIVLLFIVGPSYFLIHMLHPPMDCSNKEIYVTCILFYFEKHFIGKSLLSVLISLDVILIFLISIFFCYNYGNILDILKKAFGHETAIVFWTKYNLGRDALLSAAILALLLPVWIAGFWVIYPLLFCFLYMVFVTSNNELVTLLIGEQKHQTDAGAHLELFFDNLNIAKYENIHAILGYVCLFTVAAVAYVPTVILKEDDFVPFIMKGFLAGAATIHLGLSALKFNSIIAREKSTASLVASESKYVLVTNDSIHQSATLMQERIRRYRWRCFVWAIIVLAFTGFTILVAVLLKVSGITLS